MKMLELRITIVCALAGALGACGGGAANVPPPKQEVTRVEVEQVVEPEPSAFEQKWRTACEAQGVVGQCPAPFDQPALFVQVDGTNGAGAPPFCGVVEDPSHAPVRDALTEKSKALKACFKRAEPGAFVELNARGEAAAVADADAKAKRRAACVAKIAKPALAKLEGTRAERIVIVHSAAEKSGDEALSKEALHAVAQERGGEVNTCYDAALEVWPGLKGKIASQIVIWFDGSVVLVRTAESTLDNGPLECCINSAVRSWTFPKPADGTIAVVSFPFLLGQPEQAR